MKVSTAIRIGITKGGGQAFGALRLANGNTCALGAASLGAWGDAYAVDHRIMLCEGSVLPELMAQAPCPICLRYDQTTRLVNTITHLNDWHRWTREAIADWCESLGV